MSGKCSGGEELPDGNLPCPVCGATWSQPCLKLKRERKEAATKKLVQKIADRAESRSSLRGGK